MYDTKSRSKKPRHIGAIVVVLAALILTGWLVLSRQYVVDQVSAWQYQPSSAVAALADRTTMSRTGRFLFYASQPALDGQYEFNKNCVRKEQNTAILGCYDGRRIYLYNIADPQLDGIREVTAAHEMLHAAYQRLGEAERAKVDALLEAEYNKMKDDAKFAERVAFYARTEPGERDNELHSAIGTEVSVVSPALEAHYAQYFSDRQAVVTLHKAYASVFSELEARSKALSAQLTTLGDAIESNSSDYNDDVVQLNDDIASFNERANTNGFTTRYEFDTARSALMARANELNNRRDTINSDIVRYGDLRDQLAQVVVRSDELNRSIDSNLSPAPSV